MGNIVSCQNYPYIATKNNNFSQGIISLTNRPIIRIRRKCVQENLQLILHSDDLFLQ